MIYNILKRDFLRKKIITTAVFLFIVLMVILMSSGINMLIDLSNSLQHLFEKSSVPHFVQYHSGDIDREEVLNWGQNNKYVSEEQISQMINIDGANVFINSEISERGTVIDMGFVKQSTSFDYLLNLKNQIIEVKQGEIAVPIYYLQNKDLSIGDRVIIKDGNLDLTLTITDFVRDVQMNPSIVYSKRFVVSPSDFEKIRENTGEVEHLISFRLNDIAKLSEFSKQYSNSGLPNKGPTIDYQLLIIANSITDGLIAAVIILISLLLNIIALLCLRFVILLTIEEDYKEIGTMKAIGISPADIKRIYLSKYFVLALSAAIVGYLISLFINNIFSSSIMLYIGRAPKSLLESILPFISALFIAFVVIGFCYIILRRFNKISAVEAIQLGKTGQTYLLNDRFALHKSKILEASIYLGIRDVFLRFRLYILLFLVFILSIFIIIVPINFLNTIQSNSMVKYMGMGKSDIFMDIRQSDRIVERFNEVKRYLDNDPDVIRYEPFVTSQYQVSSPDGSWESIYMETGDLSVFPLDYIEGVEPILSNEIALSYLSASEMQKHVGDELEVKIGGKSTTMIVTGIYQDITNGGRTAKANIKPDHTTAVWYNISVDVKGDVVKKAAEYKEVFKDAQISDLADCFEQTFGNTIDQLEVLTITAIIVALLVSILITSLFLKMLTARDKSQIAIKRSLGISIQKIRREYLTRALLVLNLGIVAGTVTANTLGQKLLGLVLALFGAPRITFIINPFESYIITPLIMIAVVSITAILSTKSIREYNITDINQE